MDLIEIEVLNWDKYNARKDVKNCYWFKVHNNISSDEKLIQLDHYSFRLFFILLSCCSKNGSSCIKLVPRLLQTQTNSQRPAQLFRGLDALARYGLVTFTYAQRREEERREEKKREESQKPKKKSENLKPKTNTEDTWNAYASAYASRYGVDPVRNVRVNSQIKQLVERIGEVEAPFVAEFYLRHTNQFYQAKGHAIGILLLDAEKLRTEWKTGNQIQPINHAEIRSAHNMELIRKINSGEL